MEKYEDAIKWMTKAIDMRPNWPLYYCNRVIQYIKLGKKDLVIFLYKRLWKTLFHYKKFAMI